MTDPAWRKVANARDDIEAHLIAGILEQADVPARLEPDRSGLGDYLMGGSNPHAPVNVFVPADRYDDALAALDEDPGTPAETDEGEAAWDREDPEDPTWSEDLDQDQRPLAAPGRNPVMGWAVAVAVAALLLGFLLGNFDLFDL